MKSNPASSYKELKEKLEKILNQIDDTISFEEKSKLYQEGLTVVDQLESLLSKEYELIINIVKEEKNQSK